MKKIILTILGFFPLTILAQSGHFILKIKVSSLNKPAMAYLSYRSNNNAILDSASSNTGSFKFSGNLSGICKARLILNHAGAGINKPAMKEDALTMYLENGNINIAATDSIKSGIISGSPINDQYSIYRKLLSRTEQTLDSVRLVWAMAGAKDSNFNNQMEMLYRKGLEEREKLLIQYIKQHPDFYISGTVIKELVGQIIKLDEIEPLYNGLSENVRKSSIGIELSEMIALARATSIGSMAPLFTQNDVSDQPVRLSDFRGKYVLLDFWASWCAPCREENPNVVKAFQQYKGKNFTVLGVSLDRPGKKTAWLAAIKADGLEWTQVSDLKFWDNGVAKQYGIKGIPQNFLIDPTGKIIGKNLTGEELHKKLKEIFGS